LIPFSYSARSLLVRKTTTLAAVIGIALVVFVMASSMMLTAGIHKTLSSTGAADAAIVIRHGSDAELSSIVEVSAVPLILAAPGVKKMADGHPAGEGEVVVVAAMPKIGTDGLTNVTLRGVPDTALALHPELHIVEGAPPKPGTNEVMVGKSIRGRIQGLELGQTFELKKNRPAKVVGVFEAGGSSYEAEVWADVDALSAAFGRQGIVSSVRVRLADPASFDAFKTVVEGDKRLGLEAQRETKYYENQSQGTAQFIGFIGGAISFFFAIGAILGAMITMYASVSNRSREIGTLRALGFGRFQILTAFVLEAVLVSLLGGAIGLAASMAMGLVKFSMMNFATWSEVVFAFTPTPEILVKALVWAGVMGVFGGLLPAIRAARTSPVAAMRE
jgi:putative ABC transport system permease protein